MLSDRKTGSQIAKVMKKSKATISEHIKNLEYSSFINERLYSVIKCYDLTKKGKELQNELISLSVKTIENAGRGIKKEHIQIFKAVLVQLHSNVTTE